MAACLFLGLALQPMLGEPWPSARADAAPVTVVPGQSWQVAPGVEYSEQTVLEPQGPVQVHVLSVDLTQHGVAFDQVSSPTDSARATLSQLVSRDKDVAGVNGDFFDINATGAALGVAVDRQRGLLHAPRTGWNTCFVVERSGAAAVKQVHLAATLLHRGKAVLTLDGEDVPRLRVGQVNVYDRLWGSASVRPVVAGARRVREVTLSAGVVRSNRTRVTAEVAAGTTALIGRGAGAGALRGMKVGQHFSVRRGVDDRAAVTAISGSAQILRHGAVTTTDGQLHPRTGVGVSADHHHVTLLVADGRSESSSGLTLVQLAALLHSMGSYDALNLDGGGSSTMVAPDQAGTTGVRNSPSDGHQRPIANGLVLRLP